MDGTLGSKDQNGGQIELEQVYLQSIPRIKRRLCLPTGSDQDRLNHIRASISDTAVFSEKSKGL